MTLRPPRRPILRIEPIRMLDGEVRDAFITAYEPVPRECRTCLHMPVSVAAEPCVSCRSVVGGYPKWEWDGK